MPELITDISELTLTSPSPDRDASFALSWFDSKSGRDTLLKMGNAAHEITDPSLEEERETIEEFLSLEEKGIQKTWMLRYGQMTIGAAWIDLVENHGVSAPSVHLMIGDPTFRGRGIGRATMNAMIGYLKSSGTNTVYSRHLVSNEIVAGLNHSLGFVNDGQPYTDENELEWQNIKLELQT